MKHTVNFIMVFEFWMISCFVHIFGWRSTIILDEYILEILQFSSGKLYIKHVYRLFSLYIYIYMYRF